VREVGTVIEAAQSNFGFNSLEDSLQLFTVGWVVYYCRLFPTALITIGEVKEQLFVV
jgi:hypothetical protein